MNQINNFDDYIEPGDVLLTRLNKSNPLRTLTYFPVRSFIAHCAAYMGHESIIQMIVFKNVIVTPFTELISELGPYVHVYQYNKEIFNDQVREKYLKVLQEFQKAHIEYSVPNVLGHLLFLKQHQLKGMKKKNDCIEKQRKIFYNPSKKTCSQFMLDALIEAVKDDQSKLDALLKLLDDDDQRSFFPTKFPNISKYKFTVFKQEDKYLQIKLTDSEMKKLDITWHPKLQINKADFSPQ